MQKPRESIYKRYLPALLAEEGAEQTAYWFIFRDGQLLVREAPEPVRLGKGCGPQDYGLEVRHTLYLGTFEEVPCFAAEASEEAPAPAGMVFEPLRSLFERMEEDVFHLAGRAAQLLAWEATHRFCGRCGSVLVHAEQERAKLCPSCGLTHYPRLAPAVITAILKGDRILLAHARHFRNNMYGLISGFVEPGETLEDCVRRETMEEVGLRLRNIRYFGSQQWPFPHSLMIGFIAEYDGGEIAVDGEEIVHADWFGPDQLPVIPSGVSIARKMIDWYVETHSSLKE